MPFYCYIWTEKFTSNQSNPIKWDGKISWIKMAEYAWTIQMKENKSKTVQHIGTIVEIVTFHCTCKILFRFRHYRIAHYFSLFFCGMRRASVKRYYQSVKTKCIIFRDIAKNNLLGNIGELKFSVEKNPAR